MHEFAAQDAGEPPAILEVEIDPLCLEELLETTGEETPFPVPVGENDDAPTLADEALGRPREALPPVHELDRAPEAETPQRTAIALALDHDERSLLLALGLQLVPELDELVERLLGRPSVAHPMPERGEAPR